MERRLRWRLAEEEPEQVALFADEEALGRHVGQGEFRGLEFLHVNCRTIINRVPAASRMPFTFTINAYRGCSHACSYCFARPTHAYLDLGIGDDFERKIVVKVNAVERLRAELASPRWHGSPIAMGTNTDPYQRAEGKYHLTQGIVRALSERANPFSILTKSTLVLRDLDLLADAARTTRVRVDFSIATLDEEVWRRMEPGAPHPARRVEAVARLNEAGVASGVLLGALLPGISDSDEQLRAVIDACVAAGAVSISAVPLHLRPGVKEHFLASLREQFPEHVERYERRYATRAYVPAAESRAISERVRTFVADARRRLGRPAAATSRVEYERRPAGSTVRAVIDGQQLGLGLDA
jgi:DNA repair photolyase